MVRKQAGSGVRGHKGILFTEATQGRRLRPGDPWVKT